MITNGLKKGMGAVLAATFLLAALPSLAIEQADPLISFTTLGNHDELLVKLWSWGCFDYFSKHKFTFRIPPNDASVVEVTVRDVTGLGTRLLGSKHLGVSDLAKLDQLLHFYRNLPDDHICTSVDRIQLVLHRQGAGMVKEEYRDATCQAEIRQDLMTFWQVIKDVQDSPEKEVSVR